MKKQNEREILLDLCKIVMKQNSNLEDHNNDNNKIGDRITSQEAIDLLYSIAKNVDLDCSISRILNLRKPLKLNNTLKFNKQFEILGHNGPIERLCFDNSSEYAFSGAVDGIIKVWNIRKGLLIHSLYGHKNRINDISISHSGKYMVSADLEGTVLIRSLENFNLIHTLEMHNEVICCEFFRPSSLKPEEHIVAIILSNGILKTIKFDQTRILAVEENVFMQNEHINAICITDGGRFIICGGFWPFLLVYDTCDLNNVMVLENFQAQRFGSCKNGMKFAVSSENFICLYTFYAEDNNGNFKKRRNHEGCWKKIVHDLPVETSIKRMCFLPSFALVAACSDNFIRIYDDEQLVFTIPHEEGSIYAHPTRNIFAVASTRLVMFEISNKESFSCFNINNTVFIDPDFPNVVIEDPMRQKIEDGKNIFRNENLYCCKFYEEPLYVNVNDCQFSADGFTFITSDDRGCITSYSIHEKLQVPSEQFFRTDFVNLHERNSLSLIELQEGSKYTVNTENAVNNNWYLTKYKIFKNDVSNSIKSEEMASKYLEKEKLNFNKFSRTYLVKEEYYEEIPEILENVAVDNTQASSGDYTWDGNISSENISDESASDDSDMIASDESGESFTMHRVLRESSSRSKHWRRLVCSESSEFDHNLSTRNNKNMQSNRRILRSNYESESDTDENNKSIILRRHKLENLSSSQSESDLKIKLRSSLKKEKTNSSRSSNKPQKKRLKSDKNNQFSRRVLILSEIEEESNFQKGSDYNSSGVNIESKSKIAKECDTSPISILRRSNRKICLESEETFDISNCCSEAGKLNLNKNPLIESQLSYESIGHEAINFQNGFPFFDQENDEYDSNLNSHRLLRSELSHSEIDPTLLSKLVSFSNKWLRNSMFFKNEKVFFDSEEYKNFLRFETKILKRNRKKDILSEIPETGFYLLTDIEMQYFQTIPYLKATLNKNHIVEFFEYSQSLGIMCLENQYSEKNTVTLITEDNFISGTIVKTNGLMIYVNKEWYHRYQIIYFYNIFSDSIEYDSRYKILFGRGRALRKSADSFENNFNYLNLDIVNFRIERGLYKCKNHILQNIKSIQSIAERYGKDYVSFCKEILKKLQKNKLII